MIPWILGIGGGGLLLTVLGAVTGAVLPVAFPPMPPNVAWWALASNLLTAWVLTGLALRSRWSGWRLAAGLFLTLYVVQHFSSLIEAAFFDFFDRKTTFALLARGLLLTVVLAPALVALVGRFRAEPSGAPAPALPSRLVARFAGCAVLYLVLYFAFGIAISPFIRDFYAQKAMPGPLSIVAMQLLVRGPIFAAIALLVARMLQGPARTHALHFALVMSVIGGVAPLMIPNPFMPDTVRFAHFFEVAIENFIFGWVSGWLMTPSGTGRREMAAAA